MGKPGEFTGEVADHYARYRRGYREEVFDLLSSEFDLGPESRVLDLGCGPGQVTIPLAARAGSVIGMDPSADMLALGRASGAPNIAWLLGADSDIGTLESLLGKESVDLVTIGTALHWMSPATLFTGLAPLLRTGGGIAVISNGTPVWTQNTAWGRALADIAREWFGATDLPTCGSSDAEREHYRRTLVDAGYTDTREHSFDHVEDLDLEQVIGSFYSAAPLERLTPEQRKPFAEDLRARLLDVAPDGRFREDVPVRVLIGRRFGP